MAMRAQVVEARLRASEVTTLANDAGSVSVFTTLFNRIMTTQATEFVVIEHLGSSPQALSTDDDTGQVLTRDYNGFVQIKINTTEYFLYPDGSRTPGIPNIAAPYPINVNFQPSFILYPDIYVLPGQRWDILFNLGDSDSLEHDEYIYVFIKYTLYDGTDAVLANQLLEMGITVKPSNIDWLKRKLIEQEQY
jgi:hypothetical protein